LTVGRVATAPPAAPTGVAAPPAGAIAAAPAIELAIVEFDHYEGDLFDAVEKSRLYLDGIVR
jgi:hypothetical protein